MAATTVSGDVDAGATAGLRSKPVLVGLLGIGALAITLVLGVGLGSVRIGPVETIGVILSRAFGLDIGATWTSATEAIVWDLRLPRVLTAMVIGCGLAVAGATFQGLLRNPLADPYVLGTASGAALGAALAVLLPVHLVIVEFGLLHGLAFVGALLSAWVVFRLGGTSGGGGLTRLLLTGYAVGSVLAALLTMAMYVSGAELRQIFSFLLGGLAGSSWTRLLVATPLVLGACLLIMIKSRVLDGLLLGDSAARHLGFDVRRERGILLGLASMATAAAVAISGLIGFVGLVVPHVVRLVVGPAAHRVVPISAIIGAALLSAADLVARLVGDVPVGVVTSLLGAPFFLFLLRRSRAGYEL
ncbi:MAG TPA: iron ABC transporter permease [Candidatus Limnocylindrales bacterium]|nr:iron ABC transporter permease [Candidatus Limnocylindrales bacterium]